MLIGEIAEGMELPAISIPITLQRLVMKTPFPVWMSKASRTPKASNLRRWRICNVSKCGQVGIP